MSNLSGFGIFSAWSQTVFLLLPLREKEVMIDGLRLKVWCKENSEKKDSQEVGKKEIKEQFRRVHMPAFSVTVLIN
jgi:hypothetical protein